MKSAKSEKGRGSEPYLAAVSPPAIRAAVDEMDGVDASDNLNYGSHKMRTLYKEKRGRNKNKEG